MATVGEKYQTLVELAPDAIFFTDASGTILEANKKAAELLDCDRSHLEGIEVAELHPDERREAYITLFERTITEGSLRTETLPDGDQLYLETWTGDRVPVELHARTENIGGDTYIFAIVRDITKRYEREQELQRQREQLEEFANIVAHDLRNPLNVAEIRVELAQDDCESEHLDILSSALNRMEALIENTLLLAEQSQTITEREPVRLVELLKQCWTMVETDAASIEIDVPEDTVVHGDSERLQQVFENLFRNAVEHGSTRSDSDARQATGSEASGPSVDDSPEDAIEHDNDSPMVRVAVGESAIYVTDDGPGIPPDKQENVFETGETADDTGTGFGLAIVDRICEAHGWDIQVTEGELGGARFEITGVDIF